MHISSKHLATQGQGLGLHSPLATRKRRELIDETTSGVSRFSGSPRKYESNESAFLQMRGATVQQGKIRVVPQCVAISKTGYWVVLRCRIIISSESHSWEVPRRRAMSNRSRVRLLFLSYKLHMFAFWKGEVLS